MKHFLLALAGLLLFTTNASGYLVETKKSEDFSDVVVKDFTISDASGSTQVQTIRLKIKTKQFGTASEDIVFAKEKHDQLIEVLKDLGWGDYFSAWKQDTKKYPETKAEHEKAIDEYRQFTQQQKDDLRITFDPRHKGIVMKANVYACDSRELWNTHKFRGDIKNNNEVKGFFRQMLLKLIDCIFSK